MNDVELTALMVAIPAVLAPLLQIGLVWASGTSETRQKLVGRALVAGIMGGGIALMLHEAPMTQLSHRLAGALGTMTGLIPALRWILIAQKIAADRLNVDLDPHDPRHPPAPDPEAEEPAAPTQARPTSDAPQEVPDA